MTVLLAARTAAAVTSADWNSDMRVLCSCVAGVGWGALV